MGWRPLVTREHESISTKTRRTVSYISFDFLNQSQEYSFQKSRPSNSCVRLRNLRSDHSLPHHAHDDPCRHRPSSSTSQHRKSPYRNRSHYGAFCDFSCHGLLLFRRFHKNRRLRSRSRRCNWFPSDGLLRRSRCFQKNKYSPMSDTTADNRADIPSGGCWHRESCHHRSAWNRNLRLKES
jgi:hypothetical protein